MPNNTSRRYQDIAIINVGKSHSSEDGKTKSNKFLYIIIGVLLTVVFIGIGYVTCIEIGLLPPPDAGCCFGVLELDFDFETPAADTPGS